MLNSPQKKDVDDGVCLAAASRRFPAASALRVGCLFLLGSMVSPAVHASWSDTIFPFLATSYSYDDNLLRLDDNTPGYTGPRSDTSRQIQAGFLFNRPIGRQVLSGQAKWSRASFQHFDNLNYNGKDLQADLEWHIGNHLDGHAGATYSETLTPFSDFQSTGSDRNMRTRHRTYIDGGWLLHPSWHLRAGVSRERYYYDLSRLSYANRVEDAGELGLDYLASSGSKIGVQLRHLKGNYPNRLVGSQFSLVDGYTQDEVKANIYWRFSQVTQMQLLAGWVRRGYASFSGRDSKGANGRLIVNWAPLGKVRFTGNLWHEFGAVESALVSSSLNNGASLAAAWDISSKVRMNTEVRRQKRDFSAASGLIFPVGITDSSHTESLGLTYAPQPNIQLGLNAFRDTRKGAPIINTGSYRAKGVSFSASVQF
ncbi:MULTISPECIES: XrtB/PEP-CTERM-associated polysaccharide biosynthesis outer membrane protein EpsL [unclassified Janthinobacterium]|uniref:XrtB/PEP-CTERM-associated polysaccharide biosynthesis outer membrane protein EpsL n=1 Tax=unclassified Janthinobacterium TaxID=2610881 RepID=UPI0018C90B83|nr:XrtB/PEP-CTERM-associated polysaccharide biosynthesis outer membrane protein EpsL [Janthinobacterium sp. CG_23.4]MDH6156897.1 exopolysaccharide biosynthesis operon protein EpsL [Janthinobacterium sp. CG_23.4]